MRIENLDHLIKRISDKERFFFPSSIMFEITQRCNLRCKFCYLGSQLNAEFDMPKEKIFNLIDQLDEVGCMEIVLTGGEPLIRKDFLEIYKHIKARGILVIIFTNGTLINEKIVDCWKDSPPHWIKISLYAGSPEGYKKISGNRDAYRKIIKGAALLKDANIDFSFRFLLTNITIDEVEKMKNLADRFNVSYSLTTSIAQDTNGCKLPISFRINNSQRDKLKLNPDFREHLIREDEKLSEKRCRGYLTISNKGRLVFCPIIKDRYGINLDNLDNKDLGQAIRKMIGSKIYLNCPGI